jgi:IS30 family transposase
MPNKKLDAMRINDIDPMLDKRRKLTEDQYSEIRQRHANGESQRFLAKVYGVHRSTIGFIIYPERIKRNQDQRRARGGSKIYYDKDAQRRAIYDLRKRKKALLDEMES